MASRASGILAITALVLVALPVRAQQDRSAPNPAIAELDVSTALPDLPAPQTTSTSPIPKPNPCARTSVPSPGGLKPGKEIDPPGSAGVHPATVPCTNKPLGWYERFVNGPQDKPLTPSDKAWLAVRNLADPFNLITIGGEGAISVAADSHSAYGPGMPGYARYVGVSFTQDMTGEFFGTFAIPSLTHQDPHYHRMENASIRRRIGHAMAQVFWTQGDSGKMMLNYANLAGFAIEDEIGNLYVPGRRTDAPATAARYATALATAPIGNFVNEFLPDVASHIHVQIIVLQKIINQVAQKETMNSTGGTGGFSE